VRVGHRQALILKTPIDYSVGVFFRLEESKLSDHIPPFGQSLPICMTSEAALDYNGAS
jgi:hypothetical protein